MHQARTESQARTAENVVVIGAGYVGLVTGASLAATGQQVTVVEIDEARRTALRNGNSPIYEPGLDELLVSVRDSGHFRVIESLEEALRTPALVIVAVGTPPFPTAAPTSPPCR